MGSESESAVRKRALARVINAPARESQGELQSIYQESVRLGFSTASIEREKQESASEVKVLYGQSAYVCVCVCM